MDEMKSHHSVPCTCLFMKTAASNYQSLLDAKYLQQFGQCGFHASGPIVYALEGVCPTVEAFQRGRIGCGGMVNAGHLPLSCDMCKILQGLEMRERYRGPLLGDIALFYLPVIGCRLARPDIIPG